MRKLEYFAPQRLLKGLAVFQGHGEGDRVLALFFVIADAAGAPGRAGRLDGVSAASEPIINALRRI